MDLYKRFCKIFFKKKRKKQIVLWAAELVCSGFSCATGEWELVFPAPALVLLIPQCSRPCSHLPGAQSEFCRAQGCRALTICPSGTWCLPGDSKQLLEIDKRLRNHYLSFHGSVQLGPFSTQLLLCLVPDVFKTLTSLWNLIEIGW